MAEKNTANIGFEKQIWDAACVLRGNIDASECKSVVLGLIFLKYISDRFEEKYHQLVEEGDGFEESYLFTVRSTSPVLILSSPDAGSFYGDKVIVSGITDANATVTVMLDNNPKTANADGEGNFRIELDMNKKVAYLDITIVAENFLGVKSREISLTLANELLGSKNIRPVILCDGVEVTKLDQTHNGKTLELAL